MHNKKLTEKDLKSLRVFTSVAEVGGFTIAEKIKYVKSVNKPPYS